MNEDTLNMSVRSFLKKVGITSQRELERAVTAAVASGKARDSVQVRMTLHCPELGLEHVIEDSLRLK
ncbi:MAG: DUF6494 family protein [Gammaproteobacteria bacterium]|jgi:hypothetical protein